MKRITGINRIGLGLVAGAFLLAGCSESAEFTATDADGIARIVDAAFTEDSGLKGLLSGSDFDTADIDDFNSDAQELCDELANGMSNDFYEEFSGNVLDGAEEIAAFIDVDQLSIALVNETCPTELPAINEVLAGG